MGNGQRIPIRFGRLKPLLVVLGLTPSRSYVEIAPELLRVRMSWGFSATLPRVCVRSARRVANVSWNVGVHGWRGRWVVTGAAGPIVAIAVDPPARARMLGMPVSLRELLVSIDDPEALVAALTSD